MKRRKAEPKRLIRYVSSLTANYIRKHPALWGLSKEDVFARALEAVWKSGAKAPEQAKAAVYSALSKCRDESKHNRSCLEPYQVRKAEKTVLEGVTCRDVDAARQAAFREFVEDYALASQRSSFREVDCLRVRKAIAMLEPKHREIAMRFLKFGSIKAVALSFNVAPRTYLRREWADFKEKFISAWEMIDEENLAQIVSSNPYVFAGR